MLLRFLFGQFLGFCVFPPIDAGFPEGEDVLEFVGLLVLLAFGDGGFDVHPLRAHVGQAGGGLDVVADILVEIFQDDERCDRADDSELASEGEQFVFVLLGADGEVLDALGGPDFGE